MASVLWSSPSPIRKVCVRDPRRGRARRRAPSTSAGGDRRLGDDRGPTATGEHRRRARRSRRRRRRRRSRARPDRRGCAWSRGGLLERGEHRGRRPRRRRGRRCRRSRARRLRTWAPAAVRAGSSAPAGSSRSNGRDDPSPTRASSVDAGARNQITTPAGAQRAPVLGVEHGSRHRTRSRAAPATRTRRRRRRRSSSRKPASPRVGEDLLDRHAARWW